MSDTPRNKVNILAHFNAAVDAAELNLKNIQSAFKSAKQAADVIDRNHNTALRDANAEIDKTDKLIDTLAGEDASIISALRKKASDQRQKLEVLVSAYNSSTENTKVRDAAVSARKAADEATRELSYKRSQCEVALHLLNAHTLNTNNTVGGVAEAIEFETIGDAIEAYLLAVPMTVEVTPDDSTVIERVLLFHHVDNLISRFDVFANLQTSFSLKHIPDSLGWLRQTEEAGYKDVPPHRRNGGFKVDDVFFSYATSSQEKEQGYEHNTPAAVTALSEMREFGFCVVFYVKDEGRFYAMSPGKFPSWEVVSPAVTRRGFNGDYVDPAKINRIVRDASDIFSSIKKPFHAVLAKRQVEFASLLNAKSTLAIKALAAISKVASTETLFDSQGERLNESEINAGVGAYWTAFIAAPWENCIEGNAAMLKHLCERKIEAPHVWANERKGHYGLRVRTRDHTWIKAEIFCPPSNMSPTAPVLPDAVRYLKCGSHDRQQIVKVGPCYIKIDN